MTYKETLAWMFAQLPMYQQKGISAYNAKLDNIKLFSAHLGHPEKEFRSIHVAGTNGKGSSSHMLASILQEAGYNVGLYTSPHLKDFRERIRVDGRCVSQKFVVEFISKNKAFFEKHPLSFFEMTVGMAFDYFANKKVDIAIVEVGLGGRLDSTNILIPEVSLITNIGMDHKEILGDTLKEIAFEKAGIIKPNVPVVISEFQDEVAEVFISVAHTVGSKIVFASEMVKEEYKSGLLGNYQKKNIKGIVAALKELEGFIVNKNHIETGILNVVKNTRLLGRWQILQENPIVVCDTAHNREGFIIVLEQLKQQYFRRLHMVVGFVKEKDLEGILPLFPKNASYYFCNPNISRGLGADILKQKAAEFGLHGESYGSVKEAFESCLKHSEKSDFVYVGGSNFVVAEVL